MLSLNNQLQPTKKAITELVGSLFEELYGDLSYDPNFLNQQERIEEIKPVNITDLDLIVNSFGKDRNQYRLSKAQIDLGLADRDPNIRAAIASRILPTQKTDWYSGSIFDYSDINLTEEQFENGLRDLNPTVRIAFTSCEKYSLSQSQISRALNDDENDVRLAVLSRTDIELTNEQIEVGLANANDNIKFAIASYIYRNIESFSKNPILDLIFFAKFNPPTDGTTAYRSLIDFVNESPEVRKTFIRFIECDDQLNMFNRENINHLHQVLKSEYAKELFDIDTLYERLNKHENASHATQALCKDGLLTENKRASNAL